MEIFYLSKQILFDVKNDFVGMEQQIGVARLSWVSVTKRKFTWKKFFILPNGTAAAKKHLDYLTHRIKAWTDDASVQKRRYA